LWYKKELKTFVFVLQFFILYHNKTFEYIRFVLQFFILINNTSMNIDKKSDADDHIVYIFFK